MASSEGVCKVGCEAWFGEGDRLCWGEVLVGGLEFESVVDADSDGQLK